MYPILLLLLLFLPSAGLALATDATQEIHITADTVEYNDPQRTITYVGNVVATQGSTKMTATHAIVKLNNQHQIDSLTANGKPAVYSTLLKPDQPRITASALTLRYLPGSHRLELINKGHIEQRGNKIDAPHIIYDLQQETLLTKPVGNGRTTIVLQPQKQRETK